MCSECVSHLLILIGTIGPFPEWRDLGWMLLFPKSQSWTCCIVLFVSTGIQWSLWRGFGPRGNNGAQNRLHWPLPVWLCRLELHPHEQAHGVLPDQPGSPHLCLLYQVTLTTHTDTRTHAFSIWLLVTAVYTLSERERDKQRVVYPEGRTKRCIQKDELKGYFFAML